jgi:hypothetical protein
MIDAWQDSFHPRTVPEPQKPEKNAKKAAARVKSSGDELPKMLE